jgi:FtsP/CotA-like multicopper oxidase with cupredoxin domain
VVVLSDWSNTYPDQVLANLKKEGDYYSPKFPLQPSLTKFIHDYRKASIEERSNLVDDYKMMQQMRMSIYDFSDVAYDAYLLNGQTKSNPWTAPVSIGDTVRLRFIGAAGSTIYHVKIPDHSMQMVHAEGNDIIAYNINDFWIAPGETYDVLVNIQKNEPSIIYAESMDTYGRAYGALITAPNQIVNYNVTPFPEPLPVTREMMSMMMGDMKHSSIPMKMQMDSSDINKKTSHTHSMSVTAHTASEKHNMVDHANPAMSGMKMDETKPMNHPMSMATRKAETKSVATSKNVQDTMMMNKSSSSHPMEMSHNNMGSMAMTSIDKKSSHHDDHSGMSHTMQMDNGMKMDETMPVNLAMPMSTKKGESKSATANKNPQNTMSMNMNSSSHSMEMSHSNMGSMAMSPMDNKSPHQNNNSEMSHTMQMSTGMKMDHNISMNPSMSMTMPIEPTRIGDMIAPSSSSSQTSSGTKYENLTAAVKTNDPNKPVAGVINMELFGYMDRYIWFINGVPEYNAHPIVLEPGKRYRFVFTNTSMMHHPMHIHGHWFILRKGNGAYDPLLHTIDVPPGATITADVDTDASGQWFFHCHMLYHMMTGMSRVFQYNTLIEIIKNEAKPQNIVKNTSYHNRPIVRVDEVRPIDKSLVHHPMAHPAGLWYATFLDVGADPFHNAQRVTYKGLYGADYNKLELFINDAEMNKGTVENADIDIFYWRLISQFWAIKGGANYFNRPAETPYWQPGIGIEGLMPYYIETDVRGYYHNGSAKLDIELNRDTQITNNFFIRAGIRSILASKTVSDDAVGSGLNQMRYILRPYYRLMPALNIFVEYEHEQDYGVFRNIQRNAGESTVQNTLTFGFSILF